MTPYMRQYVPNRPGVSCPYRLQPPPSGLLVGGEVDPARFAARERDISRLAHRDSTIALKAEITCDCAGVTGMHLGSGVSSASRPGYFSPHNRTIDGRATTSQLMDPNRMGRRASRLHTCAHRQVAHREAQLRPSRIGRGEQDGLCHG